MDKNTITGIVLIALVLIGFSYFTGNQNAVTETAAPVAAEAPQPRAAEPVAAAVADTTAPFYAARKGQAREVVLENEKVQVSVNTKGGRISKVVLKEYNDQQHRPVVLFAGEDADMDFVLDTKGEPLHTGDYYFTPLNATDSTVTMQLAAADGRALTLDYRLPRESYMVDMTLAARGLQSLFPAKADEVLIHWRDRIRQQEKGFYFENLYSALTYKLTGDDTEKLSEQESDEERVEAAVDWVAFKNQYFSAVLIGYQTFTDVDLKSVQLEEKSGYLKDYSAQMATAFDPSGQKPTQFQFFFGPNQYRLLQSMDDHSLGGKDLELEDLVYLGWPIVKWINRYFTIYVFDFLTQLGLPMGVVLLLITILLHIIVYVPRRKSYMSSAKMRVLKPKVDAINEKYPKQEDAMKKQQEIMALYSQYGVNPMGGCLPVLIQMPIWIAMFNFVPNAIELRQQSFLWADDLSTYDDVIRWSYELPLIGNHLSLFCLLFCATNLIYTYMTMRQQKETLSGQQAEQMKIMQWMMYAMPVFFFFMFNKYSAGLNYYYFISILAGALVMWYLRKTTDDAKLLAKLEANYQANKNNPNKKPSGIAARLEALQKQQEAMLEAQKNDRSADKREVKLGDIYE